MQIIKMTAIMMMTLMTTTTKFVAMTTAVMKITTAPTMKMTTTTMVLVTMTTMIKMTTTTDDLDQVEMRKKEMRKIAELKDSYLDCRRRAGSEEAYIARFR